ncbi:hypothetical protein OC834_003528 [Tilletia horrida]|nr:hypothetical protein OC834_003528 [Tilletia horrida]KAK0559761.1 hypothetical protein OC844_004188 [Tilletia horrida]
MPLFGGSRGARASTSARTGAGAANPSHRPQRDTLDAPKSTLQRILLRSVPLRLPFSPSPRARPGGASALDAARDTGAGAGALPVRIRPVFLLLNVLDLTILGLLGFHPHAQEYVAINDKVLHFFGFLIATALFYGIFDIDEHARRIWFWRHFPLLFSLLACFLFGGIGSEFVQSLLPYKTFQWGDVLANMLGSALGLFLSYHAERRYRARRELERLYQPLDADDEDEFAMDLEFGIGGDEDDEDDEEEGGGRRAARRIRDENDEEAGYGRSSAGRGRLRELGEDEQIEGKGDDEHAAGLGISLASTSGPR